MGRKSSIDRAAPSVRQRIERFMRDNRMTLDEMRQALAGEFGEQDIPSRSALHRYRANLAEMTGRMREIEAASAALVGELGEGAGEKAGALLAHAVTTLATHAAMGMQSRDDVTVEEIRKLARAAKDAIDTRRISLAERQAVERDAQARLVKEQRSKLESLGKSGSIDAQTLALVMKAAYDL